MNTNTRKIIGEEAFRAFKKIFKNADPFDAPFNENIVEKNILMPEDYRLSTAELYALKKAAAAVGEKKAFYSITEAYKLGKRKFEDGYHWEVDLNTDFFSELDSEVVSVETAVYSVKGTWGVIISHEWHAVLGGSNEFMKVFKSCLDTEKELEKFMNTWKHNSKSSNCDLTWLPKLMNHVYGPEKTKKLLLKFELLP